MKCGAIVLCGGHSRRMGRDKATLTFGPELMLQRVVRILNEVVDHSTIVVVAAQGQILPELPATVIISRDELPDRGPLEGLAAGFRSMPESVEAVYATSCDVPLLKPEFIREMFNRLGEADIAVPFDGQFHHPLAAVYRLQVLPALQSLLTADRLKTALLFDEVCTTEVPVDSLRTIDPTLSSLVNCNHPQDYEAALLAAFLTARG